MTRMIPIVAVVDEDCFHALNDHISSVEQPTPLLQAVMDRNGWTLDALVAGACLKGALMPDLVRASTRENVDTPAHDHELIWRGFDYEIPSFDLDCKHDDDDPRFHMDNEGNVSDECLTQQWFDNDGIYIIKNSDRPDSNSLPCWTTWDYEGVPTLMGLAQYKDWKDGHDDD